ncbi:MAG: hypothetical protein N2643_01640 [Endomicrobia bacterium]|nr:hypothetical protein [Endomicrobiia bacterium]
METKDIVKNIEQFHNRFKEGLSVLEIPSEIKDKQKQFLEIKKAEDFFEKLTRHFEDEEYLLSILKNVEERYKNDIDNIRIQHNVILDLIENFNKIVYGNIFPLNNIILENINLIISDINYFVLSHFLLEEEIYSSIYNRKIEFFDNLTFNDNLKESIEVLKVLMRSEILLAKYYNLGAERFDEDKTFFLDIAMQEVKHFQNIKKMINIIIRREDKFSPNKIFKINAAELFLKGVKGIVSSVEKEELDKTKFISVVLDYERSIMENKYSSIFQTDDLEYNFFVKDIERETKIHISLLENKFRSYKK